MVLLANPLEVSHCPHRNFLSIWRYWVFPRTNVSITKCKKQSRDSNEHVRLSMEFRASMEAKPAFSVWGSLLPSLRYPCAAFTRGFSTKIERARPVGDCSCRLENKVTTTSLPTTVVTGRWRPGFRRWRIPRMGMTLVVWRSVKTQWNYMWGQRGCEKQREVQGF